MCNRASTKENLGFVLHVYDLSGPWRKWPGMAPNEAGKVFFRLIQTLPTFWADRIWILTIPCFLFFRFQISGFPGFQISKMWPGQGRAGLGPWAGWAPPVVVCRVAPPCHGSTCHAIFCLFSLVGQWALFTRCGPLLLSTRGGEIGISTIMGA